MEKYFQFVLLYLICAASCCAQSASRHYYRIDVAITKEKRPKRIHTKVELGSQAFPGADSSWVRSLEDMFNRSIPYKNRAKVGTYIVSVRFLIEKDDSLSEIDCLKDPGFGMCQKVKDVIRNKFHPKWHLSVNSE